MGVIRPNPTVRTIDGNTSVKNVDTIKVSNGDLSVSGRTATVDTSGSASIGGTISATRVAFGTGTDEIGGDAHFTYDNVANQLRIVGANDANAEFIIERTAGNVQKIGIENDSSESPKMRVESAGTNTKLMAFFNTIAEASVTAGSSGFRFNTQTGGNTGTVKELLSMHTFDSSLYEVVFNDDGANQDFRIESDGNSNMFVIDASQNNIGIGGAPASTAERVHIIGNSDDVFTPLVRMQTNNNDADSAPILEFYRNSTSIEAGNQLGMLRFSGNNTSGSKETYGSINVQIDSGASSDSTSMQFKVKRSGVQSDNFRIRYSEVVVNEDSTDCDFRVESNANTHMFHVDAADDIVGVGAKGTSSNDAALQVVGGISASAVIEGLVRVVNVTGDINLGDDFSAVGGQYYVNVTGSEQELVLPNGAQVGSRFSFSVGSSGSNIKVVAQPGHTVNGASDVTRSVVNDVNWCTLYARDGSGNNSWIVGNA